MLKQTEKDELQLELQSLVKLIAEQEDYIDKARELLGEATREVTNHKSRISSQNSRYQTHCQESLPGSPSKEKRVKGAEGSPYGYVLNDWKLLIAKQPNSTVSKERPGRVVVHVENPWLGFSVGALEVLKEDDFMQLSDLFQSISLDALEWIRGHPLTSQIRFLEPQQMKQLLDDFLFNIRSTPVQQIYQDYDIVERVVELALRTLLIVQEPSLKQLALKPQLEPADYAEVLPVLARLFSIEERSEADHWRFKLYSKEFWMNTESPIYVDVPK